MSSAMTVEYAEQVRLIEIDTTLAMPIFEFPVRTVVVRLKTRHDTGGPREVCFCVFV